MRKVREKNEWCEIVQFLVDGAGFQPCTLKDALVIAGENQLTALLDSQHNMS